MTDWSEHLYAIVDAEISKDPLALAERTLRSGCARLQLRAKSLDDNAFLALATALRTRCARASVPFVVNDRPDIAALAEADGLHLGQNDMPIAEARKIVGSIDIGLSTHGIRQAIEASRSGADRVAFGPIFPTSSKRNPDPVVGLDELERICRTISHPVVAIGGIDPERAVAALDRGASEVAVISSLERFLK